MVPAALVNDMSSAIIEPVRLLVVMESDVMMETTPEVEFALRLPDMLMPPALLCKVILPAVTPDRMSMLEEVASI
jgi:hypothetical protein